MVDIMREYLKEQLKKLEQYEKRADKAEREYEADPMNEEKEHLFDKCYEKEYNQYILLAEAIVNFTDNKIDFNTAKKMIQTKRSELFSLLSI